MATENDRASCRDYHLALHRKHVFEYNLFGTITVPYFVFYTAFMKRKNCRILLCTNYIKHSKHFWHDFHLIICTADICEIFIMPHYTRIDYYLFITLVYLQYYQHY